jgi:hypothetical protein
MRKKTKGILVVQDHHVSEQQKRSQGTSKEGRKVLIMRLLVKHMHQNKF